MEEDRNPLDLKADAAELSRLKALLGTDAELPQTAPEHQCLSKAKKSTMGLAVQENYECGAKKFCKEMKSCEEAYSSSVQTEKPGS